VSAVVRRGSHGWPRRLDEIGGQRSPEQLFCDGLPLDDSVPALAIVGTRRPTGAGLEAAYRIARGVAEAGWCVVSGLAVGVDAVAHRAALDADGATVAVLGCGLDVDYPRANYELRRRIAEHGTVMTEYPPGTPPAPHHFPARNRIIAGLSLGVAVVEGSITSGALVTARLALDMDRAVYAVPGSTRNPMAGGPNELIRTSQAALVTDVSHIFDDLAPALAWSGWPARRGDPPACDDCERALLGALDDAPLAMERLAADVGLPAGRVAALLSSLEVKGLVARTRAGYELTARGARCLRDPADALRAEQLRLA
jgi:DNA processing protein